MKMMAMKILLLLLLLMMIQMMLLLLQLTNQSFASSPRLSNHLQTSERVVVQLGRRMNGHDWEQCKNHSRFRLEDIQIYSYIQF